MWWTFLRAAAAASAAEERDRSLRFPSFSPNDFLPGVLAPSAATDQLLSIAAGVIAFTLMMSEVTMAERMNNTKCDGCW